MMGSAVCTYLNSPGQRVAVFTYNDDGWRTAEVVLATGRELAAMINSRGVPDAFRTRAAAG